MRGEGVETIFNHTSREIVGYIAFAVVVKTVGSKCGLLVNEAHMAAQARQLGITIIEKNVTKALQCITLYHMDMTKCMQRILLLKEIGRVAIHQYRIMTKTHITTQNLCIR